MKIKEKKSTELVKRHDREDNPFTIIETENVFFVTLGKYRLTEEIKTLKEAEENADKITLNRIIQMISILTEK